MRYDWRAQRLGWVLMAAGIGLGVALGAGEIVLRAVGMYTFMLVILRLSGKRCVAQLTPFDLVLLLIISEVTQDAMVPQELASFGIVVLSITALVGIDLATGWLSWRVRPIGTAIGGGAFLLVAHGEPLRDRLAKEHMGLEEVLAAARATGLTQLRQIRYAVLEADGQISIVPYGRPRARLVRR